MTGAHSRGSRNAVQSRGADLPRWQRRGHEALRGATLAVVAWTGASVLGLPDAAGVSIQYSYLVMAGVGAVLGAFGARRPLRAATTLVALLLVLTTSLPLAGALGPSLVRRDRPAADSGAAVDAVTVLSGGLTDDGFVRGQGLERLLDGIALARALERPLVLTVIHPTEAPRVSSRPDQTFLASLASLPAGVWFVDSVRTTHDEALRVRALARAHGWRRVALVTSPLHTRRACATFERAGLAVVCTPAHARDAAWGGAHPLHSADDRLRVLAAWLHEVLGWQAYRARGWV